MRIEASKEFDEDDIDTFLGGLEERHGDLAGLIKRAETDMSMDPRLRDDRLIWSALLSSSPGLDGELMLGLRKEITFEDPKVLNMITGRRIELLSDVLEDPDPSIKDLAERLERDYKNTYDDVKALLDLGLISVVKSGRARTVRAEVDELHIQL